jgi:predicted nucleic acid-binding protein
MILADSSVWVDYLRSNPTWQVEELDRLLSVQLVAVGDLILTEVLQGVGPDQKFTRAHSLMTTLPVVEIAGTDIAVQAARNYRQLRAAGVTVRSTIDTLIATRCIEDGLTLLHSDRDFDLFEAHLGLQVVRRPLH